jgi:hypothetical protein
VCSGNEVVAATFHFAARVDSRGRRRVCPRDTLSAFSLALAGRRRSQLPPSRPYVVAGTPYIIDRKQLRPSLYRAGQRLKNFPQRCKWIGVRGNNAGPSPVFHVDARCEGSDQRKSYFMARLFAVPRLFLISKREADRRPRLARTPLELLPPGGVRSFPARKGARPRSGPDSGPTRPAA